MDMRKSHIIANIIICFLLSMLGVCLLLISYWNNDPVTNVREFLDPFISTYVASRFLMIIDYYRLFQKMKVDPDTALLYVYSNGKTPNSKLEPIIAKDPQCSFNYAKNVVKGRFHLGEPSIAQNAFWAISYAADIIRGQFEMGEAAIAQDINAAYQYAFAILRRRFELGEPVIALCAETSFDYAAFVLVDRFPLGESNILRHSVRANIYRQAFMPGESKDWSQYGF